MVPERTHSYRSGLIVPVTAHGTGEGCEDPFSHGWGTVVHSYQRGPTVPERAHSTGEGPRYRRGVRGNEGRGREVLTEGIVYGWGVGGDVTPFSRGWVRGCTPPSPHHVFVVCMCV